ncbi:MAG: type III-B CRISPR module-associated protein Cmr5 [Epsilonproteobacteria bacterium]|nr:type III-B CRISPR module-associated protein Cmr5 [Campylobacterota bacterium]
MSKKNIEKYIPKAIEVLTSEFKDGEIPSSYNGYISAFGASIIQSGLKPTLALYENKNASTKEDKSMLTKLILQVMTEGNSKESLLRYVLDSNTNETLLKERILDIAVAIKLSIRTFKLV